MFGWKKRHLSFQQGVMLGAIIIGLTVPSIAWGEHASYSGEVQPILEKHCLECHIPGQDGFEKSGLDLSSYESVMKGTTHGSIIVPGDAFTSNLMVLIEGRADPRLKMPHGRKDLTKWEKLMLRRWINRGAKNN